ncbi:MAG: two-component system response regulator CreB [Zoogloeaceae bacterium]|jgi:two-component system catabolic regulation response regulator CreB|nr:two-component system response regulator CreB [Zoogloeaceae bacterium]
MEKMKILIVDDEPAITDTLAYALAAEGYATDCCGLGQEAVEWTRTRDYALVILDVGLPDMNGFDVCRALRRHSEAPVMFLTARAEEVDRVVGLELGADDYVAKPFSPRELVARVRAILRRTRSHVRTREDAADSGVFAIDAEGLRIACRGQWLNLTRYEYRLLACLLEHPGRVFSRDFLMRRVWQDAEETEERTVDTHIKTLRAKLRLPLPERDPIITHRGLGYSIDP